MSQEWKYWFIDLEGDNNNSQQFEANQDDEPVQLNSIDLGDDHNNAQQFEANQENQHQPIEHNTCYNMIYSKFMDFFEKQFMEIKITVESTNALILGRTSYWTNKIQRI